jgi:hypothetical protein
MSDSEREMREAQDRKRRMDNARRLYGYTSDEQGAKPIGYPTPQQQAVWASRPSPRRPEPSTSDKPKPRKRDGYRPAGYYVDELSDYTGAVSYDSGPADCAPSTSTSFDSGSSSCDTGSSFSSFDSGSSPCDAGGF